MTRRRIVSDIPATPHFDFIYGRYQLSSWSIPYFSTLMPLKHAAENLRIATDFPGSESVAWKLAELYQREVDWPRVERRILPYLRDLDHPQFFNALTIALLPTEQSLATAIQAFDATLSWKPPLLAERERFEKRIAVGPISFGYWTAWENLGDPGAATGQLRWNPDQVFAVALDGQHRLAALQDFVRNLAKPDASIKETSVPVIFLILDPDVGYCAPGATTLLVDVLRRVFIDLNKHAKIPSRARQILLDDRDPISVCVRSLVGDAVTGDMDDLDAVPARVPLLLVDWHTEQAKFEDGPYVTTILALDWAIGCLLRAKPVNDFMDYAAVGDQITVLSRWLDLDMSAAERRLDELEQGELRPFAYQDNSDNDELRSIAEHFQGIWNPVFIALLTRFAPYRDLIALRSRNGTCTLDFTNWYRLFQHKRRDRHAGRATAEYKQFLGKMQQRTRPIGETAMRSRLDEIERQKKNLAFTVVFQRAYFLAFRDWTMVLDEHLEELVTVAEELNFGDEPAVGTVPSPGPSTNGSDVGSANALAAQLSKRATEFVECLNRLVQFAPQFLDAEWRFESDRREDPLFWVGTLWTAEGAIDFTQGASSRAAEIIFWAVAMQMYCQASGLSGTDFEDFWAEVLKHDTRLTSRLWRSVRRFADKDRSAGGRILAAADEDFSQEESWAEAADRMRCLWNVLEL